MEIFANLALGFSVALSPWTLTLAVIGCFLGTIIGALPGLGPSNGVAILIPITFTLGLDATAAHLTWNGDPMRAGEATFFELSGCYRRYHAPLCRTVYLGKPPREMLDAETAQIEGIEAGLQAARAGNRTADIANAFIGVLKKHGIHREGHCGYPIGLSYPPDWGERTASIRAEDETVLEPGMAFHFMPALWMDAWGLETTETILITESGPAEPVCSVERKLFVKP